MARRGTAVFVVGAVLVMSSCSGGPGEEDLVEAVETYNDAFLAGDVETVRELLSARCLETLGEELIRVNVEQAPSSSPDLVDIEVIVEVIGEGTARVTSRFNDSEFDVERERWNVEDGEWRNDDCT